MFHLKYFIRQLSRRPLFYGLNLIGLAIGIACTFVLLSYVKQEWSYDKSIPEAEDIYRIGTDFMGMGGFAVGQELLQPILQERATAVAYATRFKGRESTPVRVDQQNSTLETALYVDTNFFRVFQYKFLEGRPEVALQHPGQIVLSLPEAERLLGEGPYLGRSFQIDDTLRQVTVSGIVMPFQGPTHLPATAWRPITPILTGSTSWTSARYYNYVKLRPEADVTDLQAFLEQLRKEEIHPKHAPERAFEEWATGATAVNFFIEPLQDVYLYSDLNFDLTPGGNPTQVRILGIIGLFILLMAGINYVNLSTAAAAARTKEVGVRKVMGAGRWQLVKQFLAEALGLTFMSAILAGGLVGLLVPLMQKITGEPMMAATLDHPVQWIMLLSFSLLVGLLAGAYPAIYLARHQASRVLQGEQLGLRKPYLRNVLVVLQFTIAAVLMIGTLVIFQQLQFMQHGDKGYQPEHLVVVENFGDLGTHKETFRELVEQHSQVVGTSINSRMPASNTIWRGTYKSEAMDQSITLNGFPIDEHYFSVMGITLVEGRNFSGDLATDTSHLILNEAAARALELEDPLGAVINGKRRVIGLVADFNYTSFREPIAPIVFNYDERGELLAIKLSGRDVAGFSQQLEANWQQFAVEDKLRYYYLDDQLAALSAKEATLSQAIGVFTVLAILIACLGLFGLTMYATIRRTREIGIRKVLGASVGQIVALLSRDFLFLVGLAFLIGVPLAWLLVQEWLSGFAYRIDLNWWMFALPAIVAVLLAFLTLSVQTVRAALGDPVTALKTE